MMARPNSDEISFWTTWSYEPNFLEIMMSTFDYISVSFFCLISACRCVCLYILRTNDVSNPICSSLPPSILFWNLFLCDLDLFPFLFAHRKDDRKENSQSFSFLFFSLLLFHFSHYFFIFLRAGWNRKLKEMVYTLTTGVQLTGLSANTDHCKEQQTYLNSLK